MSTRGAGDPHPAGAGSSETGEQGHGRLSLGRRALLTRGSVVAAGVVGAGAVATAVAGPASAQATTAVDMNTANDAGTNPAQPTELDADNDTAPAFILANTGIDTSNTGAGPNLRLTPSPAAGAALEPTASTAGGDLTATADGELWFTHDFALVSPPVLFPAPVHTEATANVYAQLGTPTRILDTRSSAGRKNIVNASGSLDSAGRLLAGKTIYINLDSLVFYAEVLLANLTIVDPTTGGYLTLWSGDGALPDVSQINFAKSNPAIANFVSVNVAEHSSTVANAIAIHAAGTTQVILDVFAFIMPGFEYAMYSLTPASTTSAKQAARLQRARQAVNAAKRSLPVP
ncbi:MAG TPA: hypothetical protein VMC83_02555 [Streptosporangiaceae bacterium]|nr:hypothetical protein [Streptosporangiaceae bacterium]